MEGRINIIPRSTTHILSQDCRGDRLCQVLFCVSCVIKCLSISSEPIRTTQEPVLVTASPSPGPSSTTTTITSAQNLSTTTPTTEAPTPVVEEVAAPILGATARNNSMINITAQLGSSVFLPCVTHHSMERQVSWVRRRDWHILTSGLLTYTKEGRFTMHHSEGSTKWTLAIKYLKLEDEGVYECQISTGGGVVAQLVNLTVVEPRAVIPGSGEHHVQSGSTISLVCYIEQSPVAPQYIFWYHNSRMINYDRERGGVRVNIETGQNVRSHLSVTKATPADSGNYTCAAANTRAASITVYVTEDNQIAAIQPYAVDAAGFLHPCLALLMVMAVVAEVVCHSIH
ncbi:hemicentin-2-like isoform X2 [Scylla paramamosain]|uniref:hemicentin-2-like isoform X2 n=1 Tax=Scylla paramamosain TaxID=85552 RepID=UPI003083935E